MSERLERLPFDEFRCWLAQFSTHPCDGQIVRCHLIPKQRLKRVWNEVHHAKRTPGRLYPDLSLWGTLDDLLFDRRTWVPGCGGITGCSGHHGMLDTSRTLRISFDALPIGTVEIAFHLMILPWLEREYPMAA